MFNWKSFGHVNFNYPQCLQSIYQKIHQKLNILVDRNYGESWSEKMANWMDNGQHMIDWQMFLFLVLTLTVFISVYIITVEWLKATRSIAAISISHEMLSDNEDDRTSLVYYEFIRKSSEINEILKSSTIFAENYNQFYVVSIGMEANSSLQINEIFDDPNHDEMMEFKTIVNDIIDRVEMQLGNCQKIIPKTVSRIPLLRSRQR